jgi:superfamily II DNA or RNA helicase
MQALFDAIRDACSAKTWSRGVELSRAGAVIGERADNQESVFKVATQVGMTYATVTLWPADEDWMCDCRSTEVACAHVAAAAIAWRRARQDGQALPAPKAPPGHIEYHFQRAERSLTLARQVVQAGQRRQLEHALTTLTTPRTDGSAVVITQVDVAMDHVLGSRPPGRLPRELMPKLLAALAPCSQVYLDNVPIKISLSPVLPQGRLVDQGDGFLLYVEAEPSISEVFTNGVVLCGDTLRLVGDSGLTAREREELPNGRVFSPDAVAELVTEVLPALRKRIPVEVRSTRLPTVENVLPRLVLDMSRDGEALVVTPALVYGTPPIARVEGERLLALGGQTVPRRDLAAEEQLKRQLRQTLSLLPGQPVRVSGSAAVRLVERLRAWSGEIRGTAHHAFALAGTLRPRWQLEATHFDVDFEVAGAPPGANPARVAATTVMRAWQAGEAFVPLVGGGWAPLPGDWLERFGQRVADLLAARSATGGVPTCALPDLARLCADLEQPLPPELAGLQTLLEEFNGLPTVALPPDLQAILRPYQQTGINWLVFLRQAGLGALLADDMGLGKTLQALCALQGRTLVVAPTSVLPNWAAEIRRFRPGLRTTVYHGGQRQLDPTADITLTTYALLRLDTETLAREVWDTVILDEAPIIKNPDSQVARAAYRLQGRFRMALSGTPVENRLDELWSQLHFLNPGLLGGRQHFQEHYARPIAAGQHSVAARLQARLRPFILRRRKQEVAADLPPRSDMRLHCVLSAAERQVYEAIQAATRAQVVAQLAAGGSVLQALEALLRLRQACCHIGLVPGQQAATSAKVQLLCESLEQVVAEGHKALVFSQWTTLLDRVEPPVRTAGLDFVRLDGATRDRAGVVQRFQSPTGPPVMLISLRAGGLGLNLTAADHVFLLDPWWNPAVEEQAADRVHRLGQDRPVLVYHLIAEDTVEERILVLQEHKRALSDTVLTGTERAASLTRDDVLALLA